MEKLISAAKIFNIEIQETYFFKKEILFWRFLHIKIVSEFIKSYTGYKDVLK